MVIEHLNEYQISSHDRKAISELLKDVFDYEDIAKQSLQVPHFRLIAREKKQIIGHLAVHYRKVALGGDIHFVFGIEDLCVLPHYQDKRIATHLLELLEKEAKQYTIDFILLFGEKKFYEGKGFTAHENYCRWVMIHQSETRGVLCRPLKELLVKQMSSTPWNGEAVLDLLGPVF